MVSRIWTVKVRTADTNITGNMILGTALLLYLFDLGMLRYKRRGAGGTIAYHLSPCVPVKLNLYKFKVVLAHNLFTTVKLKLPSTFEGNMSPRVTV